MNEIPIIILTAEREEVDIIPGLDVGADNYVTKHFSPKVLVASIMAVLRTKAGNSAHWKKEK